MGHVEILRLARRRLRTTEDYRAFQRAIAKGVVADLKTRGVDLRGRRVLELAAGRGGYTELLDQSGALVTATDIYREPVFDGRLSHVNFESVDVRRPFPFGDAEFDFVLCLSLVEHIPDRSVLYRETKRVLVPDGLMMVSFPPFWSLSTVGGHQYKPFHLLGERIAVGVSGRKLNVRIPSYDFDYGEGRLYPLKIADVRREIEVAGFSLSHQWARMSRVNTLRLPGIFADLMTWQATFLAKRPT